MKKFLFLFLFALVIFGLSFTKNDTLSDSIKGVVCLKIAKCDYMIVCLKNGNYSVVEDYYDKCDEGDVLVGEFQSYGFKDAYNITKDKTCRVYIEDWEYNEKTAIEKYKKKCK